MVEFLIRNDDTSVTDPAEMARARGYADPGIGRWMSRNEIDQRLRRLRHV